MDLLVLAAPFTLLGALVGRWWTVALPLPTWAAYYLGLVIGWWGSGVGDGWWLAMAIVVVLSAAGAAAGVLVRKALAVRLQAGS